MPFTGMTTFNLEEERRLFYVAGDAHAKNCRCISCAMRMRPSFCIKLTPKQLLHEIAMAVDRRYGTRQWQSAGAVKGRGNTRTLAQLTQRYAPATLFPALLHRRRTNAAQAVVAWLDTQSRALREQGLQFGPISTSGATLACQRRRNRLNFAHANAKLWLDLLLCYKRSSAFAISRVSTRRKKARLLKLPLQFIYTDLRNKYGK